MNQIDFIKNNGDEYKNNAVEVCILAFYPKKINSRILHSRLLYIDLRHIWDHVVFDDSLGLLKLSPYNCVKMLYSQK